MSTNNNSSKIHGYKEEAIGTIKEHLGTALSNQSMEIEGRARKLAGSAEVKVANKETTESLDNNKIEEKEKEQITEKPVDRANDPSILHGISEKVIGTVKDTVGTLTGNTNLEIEGKARKHAGNAEVSAAFEKDKDLKRSSEGEPVTSSPSSTSNNGGDLPHSAKRKKLSETEDKPVDRANEPNLVHGYKEQAIGTMKDTAGSLLSNAKMEIEGKARKFSGSSEVKAAKELSSQDTAER